MAPSAVSRTASAASSATPTAWLSDNELGIARQSAASRSLPLVAGHVSTDANVVAAGIGEGELVHAPRPVLDRRDVQTGCHEKGVPFIDVGGDDAATSVVRVRVHVWNEIEVEHALVVEINEREPVVVTLNVTGPAHTRR